MPKGRPELIERRKKEILDACEQTYRAVGFYGVTIKGIGEQLSMTRSSIYNYFQTKEEILLGLMVREYWAWLEELAPIVERAKTATREELADFIASTFSKRDVLLRLFSTNLSAIEQHCRVERLVELKKAYMRLQQILNSMLNAYESRLTQQAREDFILLFTGFALGAYPISHQTEKQDAAMTRAGGKVPTRDIYYVWREFLTRVMPKRELDD